MVDRADIRVRVHKAFAAARNRGSHDVPMCAYSTAHAHDAACDEMVEAWAFHLVMLQGERDITAFVAASRDGETTSPAALRAG